MKKMYLDGLGNIGVSEKFDEINFVSLLFPLLYKYGVLKINQGHLCKQLFIYKQVSEYNELFKNINSIRNFTDINAVDIYNGIIEEKTFSDNVIDGKEKVGDLELNYDENIDSTIDFYSKCLNNEQFILMDNMAKELSLLNKIEEKSQNELLILGEDSNRIYELVSGIDVIKRELKFELLTDGKIEGIYYYDHDEIKNCYFNDPTSLDAITKLSKVSAINVSIRHSSYAIMQGLCDNNIRYLVAYTKLLEENILTKISDIANKVHDNESLTKDEPYVRKLILR